MRRCWLILTATMMLAMPAALQAQQRGDADDARRSAQARRDSLEAEVVRKFVERLTRELRLDAEQRTQTERILERSTERRRALNRDAADLRGRFYRALRSDTTTDAEFTRLLADHEALRTREHDLWRQDQKELAAVLSARQRVQFIMTWAHFQDTMREILSQRGGRDRSLLP